MLSHLLSFRFNSLLFAQRLFKASLQLPSNEPIVRIDRIVLPLSKYHFITRSLARSSAANASVPPRRPRHKFWRLPASRRRPTATDIPTASLKVRAERVLELWEVLSDSRKELVQLCGPGLWLIFLAKPASIFIIAIAFLARAFLLLGAVLAAFQSLISAIL